MQTQAKYEMIKQYLLNAGILIGSCKWGGTHDNSDIDLVFSKSQIDVIFPRLEKYKDLEIRYIGDYSTNAMYNIDNIKIKFPKKILEAEINIIVYQDNDIEKIKELNIYMEQIKGTKISELMIENKKIRIKVVEIFLDYLFNPVKKTIPFIDELPF